MQTTTEPGANRLAMTTVFLSLMVPVLPFTADGEDPGAGVAAPAVRVDTPERVEDVAADRTLPGR